MIEIKPRSSERETAVLVGIINRWQDEEKSAEYLDELEFLADTAGSDVAKRFTQKLDVPHPKTFLGSGKMDEIQSYVKEHDIDMAIFDDELTPSQLKNIEQMLKCKVLDRTNLILDIFAARAQTSYARTQVELAQYEYLLPRLTRMWTHLERQKGGIGMRGPGETQIETDRRIIQQKISLLKEKLTKIDKQMATQRGNRGSLVRVALVGYTNVGKSTLMNRMAKSEVLAENKLFATLDTTVRKVVIDNLPFLLSDTVGFIRKLPTQLVESFKSTLDEVREADVLIHVVDISHSNFMEHIESVNETIGEIDGQEKPTIMVFNKIDLYKHEEPEVIDPEEELEERYWTLEDWERTWMSRMNGNAVFISAENKTNMDELRKTIYKVVSEIHSKRFPFENFLY
ncbi:MAG: GTPase HflX [Bacteroidetes bacterium]|uniref:GTPase HflX n=1 Tax=Phaeocystidibacter marisrubri TaxID=1577780 RepID=A0A6L3ZFC4_9FLAO|nr:GTPase HflX [Phaeocystidibacter marisrubri]KAB2816117.1 GTPase HflX [Phaeocystidibacter marisrubri]TNE26262.1 MAG: GTPase HflX [Bacteroidota bacterium]GGH67415.1 GTPase HflX [Phaeocystidibacter marisrubri]